MTMSALEYIGPAPTGNPTPSNNVVCTTAEASSLYGGQILGEGYALTSAEVANLIQDITPNLTTVSATQSAYSSYLTNAQVAAGEADYLPLSQVGVPGGAAVLGEDGLVNPANIPNTQIVNNRSLLQSVIPGYGTGVMSGLANSVGQAVITTVTTLTTSDGTNSGTLLAQCTIADPGWPYIPLVFGWVLGDSGGSVNAPSPPSGRTSGNGWYGVIQVTNMTDENDPTIYGYAKCNDSPYANIYPIIPFTVVPSSSNDTTNTGMPSNGKTGDMTLGMYGSASGGTGYNIYPSPMVFFAIPFPAHQAVTT